MLSICKKSLSIMLGVLIFAGMGLSACAPMNFSPEADPAVATSAKDPFAAEVSAMATGTTAVIPSPLAADSMVKVGGFYTSALGLECRPVEVMAAGTSHRLAVCRNETGWFTVDSIFEAMPR